MKFTEAQLEAAFIQLLGEVGYPHVIGAALIRQPDEVLIKEDLRAFLAENYHSWIRQNSERTEFWRIQLRFIVLDSFT